MKSRLHDCFFSIIVPVYNREQLLRRTLESVLSQAYTDYECILIDNASTDATGELCQQYAEQTPTISTYLESRRGVSFARNTGIRHAKGTYCILLDSDNTFPGPDTLQRLQEAIESQPVSSAFFCGVQFDNQQRSALARTDGHRVTLQDYLHHQGGELAPIVATEWLKRHPFPEDESLIAEQADLLWIPLIQEQCVRALSLPVIAYHSDAPDRVSQRAYHDEHAHELATYYQTLYTNHGQAIHDDAGIEVWMQVVLRMLLYSRLAGQTPDTQGARIPLVLHRVLTLIPRPFVRLLLRQLKQIRYNQTQEARLNAS